MLKRKRLMIVVIVLAVALSGAGLASTMAWSDGNAQLPAAIEQYGITWDVVASGGTTMSSSSFTLLSTTGQTVAGMSSGGEYTLSSGYWQKFLSEVLLPIIFG